MQTSFLRTAKGNRASNQIIEIDEIPNGLVRHIEFKSYGYCVAIKEENAASGNVTYIDRSDWYQTSNTTARYRCQFLGESKSETKRKIDSGEYVLTDLN